MITIKDIALKANVSEGTVDRVIHNRPGVSKKTKEKVNKIIHDSNFSVNPVASALAKKNKHIIASLIPEHNESDIFWKAPYLGIVKATNDVKNFGIQVNNYTYNQYDPISYVKTFETLLESNPSAVILTPVFLKESKKITSKLDQLNIPYIFLNIDIEGFTNKAFIGQDSHMAGYIAGKLMNLCATKPSTFLIIQGKQNSIKNNAISIRIKGFNDYFIKNNINSHTQILKLESFDNSSETKEKINNYLIQHPEVKGILVPSSRISFVANCINNSFYKQLVLIGFDNTPQNINYLKENVISFLISQKPFEQGYKSIRLMTDYLVHKKELDSKKIYLPIDILTKENVDYNERND